jgi:aldose sugar dehydrogenase
MPYGIAFAPDGRLWEVEHGPRGGDEVNLMDPGKNYGWPLVSCATNDNMVPVTSPDTRPDLAKPVATWSFRMARCPDWKGSALISAMASQTRNRVTFDGKGGATPAERWSVGHRMRDVAVASDGAVWSIEDANPGVCSVSRRSRIEPAKGSHQP